MRPRRMPGEIAAAVIVGVCSGIYIFQEPLQKMQEMRENELGTDMSRGGQVAAEVASETTEEGSK
eukprot:CAMPEP_0203766626 /NCGR_PEP_ID=MMETSP0099_2-20121227/529_1 /ASSEMBLY_ACC=CAM_ASM_000209 /TAXON_ID=96639 /ORGANISM=" , Strain NY0313808BC1" /LENGTH=64 /DNA_ID=CAMNT_0050663011 /DNA_START=325 /DNA_END=519 /DNA_ORIENTATION=-